MLRHITVNSFNGTHKLNIHISFIDYDDFYVHISGITTSRLFSRQQIGLFNYIIHHIKEKKYIQNIWYSGVF